MQILRRLLAGFLIVTVVLILLVWLFRNPDIPVSSLRNTYANANSRFAPILGMTVHYRDAGPRQDPYPLVFIHGTASSLHTWDSLVQRFPQRRCISMDLPGFGLTGPHPQRRYDAASYQQFLDSLFRILTVDSPILVGNSLGGFIAWNYAANHAQVKGLVLVDPAGFPLGSKNSNLGFRIARIPVLNQLLTYITPRSLVRKSAEESYGNPALVTDELVQRYYDLTLRSGNRQALIDRLQGESGSDTSLLAQIKVPVMIIWGEEDRVVPFSHLERFRTHLPTATVATYKGVGHIPMEEAPDLMADDMRKWMDTLFQPLPPGQP